MTPLDAGGWNVFGLGQARFETLVLVFVRILSMLALVPIFSAKQVPVLARVGIGFILSYVVGLGIAPLPAPLSLGALTVAIAAQIFVGMVFGFVAFLVFTGVQFAGEIIDTQIGFTAVNVINPTTQQSVTLVGELQLALATLVYLGVDAHHQLLRGLTGSFSLVPLPYIAPQFVLEGELITFLSRALLLVFQIAAPVAISLFVVNVSLALMAKVAPQMNVFVVGFPLQISAGLIMLIVSMPLLGLVLPQVFAETPRQFDTVLRAMNPPSPAPSPSPVIR